MREMVWAMRLGEMEFWLENIKITAAIRRARMMVRMSDFKLGIYRT